MENILTNCMVFAALTVAVSAAQAGDEKDFIGFWEGIDESDGSAVTVSVRDLDEDDTLEFSWHESNWSFCDNTERALISGTGIVYDDVLTSTNTTLECFEPGFEQKLCFGFAGGDCTGTIPGYFELTFDNDNEVLLNDDGGTLIVVHRISDD